MQGSTKGASRGPGYGTGVAFTEGVRTRVDPADASCPDVRMKVMVIGTGTWTASWLARRLAPRGVEVFAAAPGPELIQAVREWRPEIVVLDEIDARPQVAPLEVALLKDQDPGVRIIARSSESSELDVEVIEQGVFCYLGGCSLDELLRVVESAALGAGGEAGARGTEPVGGP
jgi:DNA-binding NtrC family response regulator